MTIAVFDNALDKNYCTKLYNYLQNNSVTNVNTNLVPWEQNNNIPLSIIKDLEIKHIIELHKKKLSYLISLQYNKIVYPEFSDLVFWCKDQFMIKHIDNLHPDFKQRYISTVTYLNDDYEGGETFIEDQGQLFYNKPKTGSTLCFSSTEKHPHGVNKITKGHRGTLAIWFTLDPLMQEDIKES